MTILQLKPSEFQNGDRVFTNTYQRPLIVRRNMGEGMLGKTRCYTWTIKRDYNKEMIFFEADKLYEVQRGETETST